MNPPATKTFPDGYDRECPSCASGNVDTTTRQKTFQYGNKEDGVVELSADVPVRACRDCGFEFTDGAAEDVMQEAISRHLGRMTPSEVRGIRKNYGLSRRRFSEVTLLGEASLARWEAGELVQNAAYDQFLHLLTFEDNMARLRRRKSGEPADTEAPAQAEAPAETEALSECRSIVAYHNEHNAMDEASAEQYFCREIGKLAKSWASFMSQPKEKGND